MASTATPFDPIDDVMADDNVPEDDDGEPLRRVRSRSGTVMARTTSTAPPLIPSLANVIFGDIPEIVVTQDIDRVYLAIGALPDPCLQMDWDLFSLLRGYMAKVVTERSLYTASMVGRFYSSHPEDSTDLISLVQRQFGGGTWPYASPFDGEPGTSTIVWNRDEPITVLRRCPLLEGLPQVQWR